VVYHALLDQEHITTTRITLN